MRWLQGVERFVPASRAPAPGRAKVRPELRKVRMPRVQPLEDYPGNSEERGLARFQGWVDFRRGEILVWASLTPLGWPVLVVSLSAQTLQHDPGSPR